MPVRAADYTLRQLFGFFVSAFTILWATQIYGTVGNHPVLAWLYVPFIAFIVGDNAWAELRIAEAGLGLQTVLIDFPIQSD